MEQSLRNEPKVKARNYLYTQQLRHLPQSISGLIKEVDALNPERYAYIVHDRDPRKDGNGVAEPHLHLGMWFENPRHLSAIAKALGDRPQQVNAFTGRYGANNLVSYLVHATTGAGEAGKATYAPSEVTASPGFDYPGELARISAEVKQSAAKHRVDDLLNKLYAGEITEKDLRERLLTGSEIARYDRQISVTVAARLRVLASRFNTQHAGETRESLYLYGETEVGKSHLANVLAEKRSPGNFYVSGSSRGLFEGYGQGSTPEPIVIIEELTPGEISYADLKRLTSPIIGDPQFAPSRYRDRALAVSTYIFTSPYSPLDLYSEQVGSAIDAFGQWNRRLTVLRMTPDEIQLMVFDPEEEEYVPKGDPMKNPYSRKANSKSSLNTDPVKTFEALGDELGLTRSGELNLLEETPEQ